MALLSSCKITDISDEEQSASLAPYSAHEINGSPLQRYIEERTAVLIGSEGLEIRDHSGESSAEHSGTIENALSLKFNTNAPLAVGTAVAIDSRGYFLTAGHCIEGNEVFVVYSDRSGKTVTERVQPIWVKTSSLTPVDFGLFHIEGIPAKTFAWAESFEIGQSVFSAGSTLKVGEEADPAFRFSTDSFAGEVKKTREVGFEETKFQLIWHKSPVRGGNSGGPLVNNKGELIAVNYAASSPIRRTAGTDVTPMAFAIRPDRDWIQDLIEKDWAKRQEQ